MPGIFPSLIETNSPGHRNSNVILSIASQEGQQPFTYSWGHLVVPYTEELISRPFLDEKSIWWLFWDRVDPWPAAGCFFPALCHFCIGFHWIAKSHGAGTVFSGGFVSKTLRWISFQLYLLHFPKPILTSLIAAWICFQQWQCSCFYANMTGLPLSSLLYFHHH